MADNQSPKDPQKEQQPTRQQPDVKPTKIIPAKPDVRVEDLSDYMKALKRKKQK